jgi:exonuclease SbcC
MRPLKLTLEGFYGVRDGMKRDSVTLDLESMPVGLIALVGPNGAGKTTIMDNLHPYPIMPSRASKLSVDAFSYWDHICASNALKELEWEHDGIRYRSTFTFRKPGKTGKAEYYLVYRSMDGTWRPVSLPDGTVSDGKAETYNRCVDAINGTLETFFTSVFSAQNRRPLASYGAGEIKTLLAEMLGIEHLKALATKANDVAKVLARALDGIQSELVSLAGKRRRQSDVDGLIAAESEALKTARAVREAKLEEGSKLTQERATFAAKVAETATVEARLRELGVRRNEVTQAVMTLTSENEKASARSRQRITSLTQSLAVHQAMLAKRDLILGAAGRRDEAQLFIGREEPRIAPLQQVIADLEAKQLSHTALQASLHGMQTEGATKAAYFQTLTAQAEVADKVPCVGMEIHTSCPLLQQALQARSQAETQRIAVADLRKSYREKKALADGLLPMLDQLAVKRSELIAINESIATARHVLQKATELAASKPLLEAAAKAIEEGHAELKLLADEETERSKRFETEKARMVANLAQINDEAKRLAAVDVTAMIVAIDQKLAVNREAIAAADGRIEALIRSQTMLQGERETLAKELDGYSATQVRADRLSDEIAHWRLLGKGLGNDGVVALTIDDAGPALTNLVNELLLACYGMRFTVEIRTQRALASGEMREGFEILVHDADTDSTKSVTVMSGGQKVWINECLTRGIALYLAQNAGQEYQTLFSDESDGPLDADRKLQFMRMKREVLRQGGYEREFFISQTPDLVAEADAIIDVSALAA